MKYTLATIIVLCTAYSCSAQLFKFDSASFRPAISIGLVNFYEKPEHSSDIGVHFGGSFYGIYIDLSSNLAYGRGEEVDFNSNDSYEKRREDLFTFNIGVVAATFFKDRAVQFEVIPVIGFYSMLDVYQSPEGYDTKCFSSIPLESNLNAGVVLRITDKKMGLLLGMGTCEKYKLGLNFRIN